MSDSVRFGKYELTERIALGGMAEIFRARSASLGGLTKNCVIKRILPEFSGDRQFVSMFIDEARITIGLNHDHIVQLFDFGQVDGTYYMAMELVDGCDLVDVLRSYKRQNRVVPILVAAYVASCMCKGLHHAHVQRDHRNIPLGVVHRDVSPHNVFLGRDGGVKVGDFGIASARNKTTQTQAGTVKGKFAYMSPEQTGGGIVDARSDIWAVGVVLHEMLSGGRLFACDNPILTISRVNEMVIKPPSSKNDGVPPALDEVVLKSLKRNCKERFQNANDMAEALDAWIDEMGGFGKLDFAEFMADQLDDEQTMPSPRSVISLTGNSERTPSLKAQKQDPEVTKLLAQLVQDPNLWTLVQMGERYLERDQLELGLSALRVAAAVFSSRGMLVQAICAHHPARAHLDEAVVISDLKTFSSLRDNDRSKLRKAINDFDRGDFYPMLMAATEHDDDDEPTNVLHPAPLFGRMHPDDFARLALAAKVTKVGVGTVLVTEGERSKSLYAIGRGRSVVHCVPGDTEEYFGKSMEGDPVLDELPGVRDGRIYLSALADGDFFGEFSFLTQQPRSASVEAITDNIVLELDEKACETILQRDPAFSQPLLEFYKERVGELMMAKNPVFSILSPDDRRELLMRSQLRAYGDQDEVLAQGDVSEEMYFIKHGEVEVYRTDQGLPVFINKLREGEFFGEMAAIHGTPRTASIRAMGDVELFCLHRRELETILSKQDDVRRLFEAAIAARAEETSERMAESRRIFQGS